jgi:hypothetical protein
MDKSNNFNASDLRQECTLLMEESISIKDKINKAKTKTKKAYYTKKLHKNNALLYKAMNIYEYINQQLKAIPEEEQEEFAEFVEVADEPL